MNAVEQNKSAVIIPPMSYGLLLLILAITTGCSQVTEVPKVLWGSSTKALEEARAKGMRASFTCNWQECFDVVLHMADKKIIEEEELPLPDLVTQKDDDAPAILPATADTVAGQATAHKAGNAFDIFINDPKKQFLVVLGVPGSVDTTEVGIFFTQIGERHTKVEVTSLATNAKVHVAEVVFKKLAEEFDQTK